MHHRPSDGHPEPHLNTDAATLLHSHAFESRARRAIEVIAARIAAREALATGVVLPEFALLETRCVVQTHDQCGVDVVQESGELVRGEQRR